MSKYKMALIPLLLALGYKGAMFAYQAIPPVDKKTYYQQFDLYMAWNEIGRIGFTVYRDDPKTREVTKKTFYFDRPYRLFLDGKSFISYKKSRVGEVYDVEIHCKQLDMKKWLK